MAVMFGVDDADDDGVTGGVLAGVLGLVDGVAGAFGISGFFSSSGGGSNTSPYRKITTRFKGHNNGITNHTDVSLNMSCKRNNTYFKYCLFNRG